MKTILMVRGETPYDGDSILGFFEDTENGLVQARYIALAESVPQLGRIRAFEDVRIYRVNVGGKLETFEELENW